MPFTTVIVMLLLIAAGLGVGAVVRRSRRLGIMAAAALCLAAAFIAILVLSLGTM